MKDQLFDSEEKRMKAIAAFTMLLNNEGWKLLEQMWDANIDFLREQLESGSESETKEDVNRIRDKLKLMREIRNTPQVMIKKLTPQETRTISDDPYPTIDDLQEKRKNVEQPIDRRD